MSEPITGTAASVLTWKALGGLAGIAGISAGLATYVVMTMTKPRNDQEWHIGILTTIIGSICGGSALITYLQIQHWVNDMIGLMGLVGICFMCGLPSWLIVRSFFTYVDKRKDADITQIVGDGVAVVRQVKDAL